MHHEGLLDVVGSSVGVFLLCLFPMGVVVRVCTVEIVVVERKKIDIKFMFT